MAHIDRLLLTREAKDSTPRYTIRFPKFKEGGCAACYEKTTATYGIDLA